MARDKRVARRGLCRCFKAGWAGPVGLACVLAALLLAPACAQAEPQGRRLALLVGVGSFADQTFSRLSYSRNDVEAMRDWLTSPLGGGFAANDVTVLLDEKATRAAIVHQAHRLAAQAGPDDLVLLYFSTHGFYTTDKAVGIVSYDTRATGRLTNRGGPIVYRDEALTREDLNQFLDGLRARQRVVIIDVCYSAQLAGDQAASAGADQVSLATQPPVTPGGQDKITLVLASSLGTEPAWESQQFKGSIFTHNLLSGLRKSGGDLLAAFDLARGETERQSRVEKGIVQTPCLISRPPRENLSLAISKKVQPTVEDDPRAAWLF